MKRIEFEALAKLSAVSPMDKPARNLFWGYSSAKEMLFIYRHKVVFVL
ncbi:hypothetical protein V6R21_08020 [Limibacter armeniacum]